LAEHSDGHHAKSWLDHAVIEKQCPLTPVDVRERLDGDNTRGLLKRITVSDHKLEIKGTDDPDNIVVSAGDPHGFVRVAWDGRQLERFGPVTGIFVRGEEGDDVLILKPGVNLQAVLDGGDRRARPKPRQLQQDER
jgi:hypothetical protein